MSKVSVERMKPTTPPVVKVVVELSPREAACLSELLGIQCSAGVMTDLFCQLNDTVEEEGLDPVGRWELQPDAHNFRFFLDIPF